MTIKYIDGDEEKGVTYDYKTRTLVIKDIYGKN